MARSRSSRPSRFWLFLPFILLILGIAGWSAWWSYAGKRVQASVDAWIVAERAKGATMEWSARSFGGYPFRFETTFENPVYKTADGAGWEGQKAMMVMQPWKLNHAMGFAPGHNVITDGAGIRNSIDLDRKGAVSFSWTKAGMQRVGLQTGEATALLRGEEYGFSNLSLNFAPRPESPDDLMVAIQWDKLTIPKAPSGAPYLGTEFGPSRMIGEITKFYPAYKRTGGNARKIYDHLPDAGSSVTIAQLVMDWGPLKLAGKADVSFAGGRGNGSFGLRIDDAEALRTAMQAAGKWTMQEQAAVATLETASANDGFLMFIVVDSMVFLGPIQLFALPPATP